MAKKSLKTKTNAEGYQLVLSCFPAPDGSLKGAKLRLGKALGKTRAIAGLWEKRGIPFKYRTQLCRITGLRKSDIWPEEFA